MLTNHHKLFSRSFSEFLKNKYIHLFPSTDFFFFLDDNKASFLWTKNWLENISSHSIRHTFFVSFIMCDNIKITFYYLLYFCMRIFFNFPFKSLPNQHFRRRHHHHLLIKYEKWMKKKMTEAEFNLYKRSMRKVF